VLPNITVPLTLIACAPLQFIFHDTRSPDFLTSVTLSRLAAIAGKPCGFVNAVRKNSCDGFVSGDGPA
jgi:hypothetical protein